MTSAPNLAMSNREAAADISSIAQQARPSGIGQQELARIQSMAASSLVTTVSPSILESYPTTCCFVLILIRTMDQLGETMDRTLARIGWRRKELCDFFHNVFDRV